MILRSVFFTGAGKFVLFFSIMFLFSVNCSGSFGNDDEEETARSKIQKNSAFTPACSGKYGEIECSLGEPACGTEIASGELKVYCIDSLDKIQSEASCKVDRSDKSDPNTDVTPRPICSQLARTGN